MKKPIYYTLLLLLSLMAVAYMKAEQQPPGDGAAAGIEATPANDLQTVLDQFIAKPVFDRTAYEYRAAYVDHERAASTILEPALCTPEYEGLTYSGTIKEVGYPLQTYRAAWLYLTSTSDHKQSPNFTRYSYQLF